MLFLASFRSAVPLNHAAAAVSTCGKFAAAKHTFLYDPVLILNLRLKRLFSAAPLFSLRLCAAAKSAATLVLCIASRWSAELRLTRAFCLGLSFSLKFDAADFVDGVSRDIVRDFSLRRAPCRLSVGSGAAGLAGSCRRLSISTKYHQQ